LKEINKKIELHSYFEARLYFIKNLNFYCIFKGFHKKLDYLTIVSLRSFFVKNNFVSLSLFQFADFVCKLKRVAWATLF